MTKEIILNGRTVRYELERKNVKNINIRVKRDLTVHVSASTRVTLGSIEDILRQKADFILSALEKYGSYPTVTEKHYESGECFVIFGKSYPLMLSCGSKNQAVITSGEICMTVKDTSDEDLKRKTLEKCLDSLCQERILLLCREVHKDFKAYGIEFPTVKFRHMKSRWGSCQYKKGVLTFNLHLIHAPEECIRFVIYHEFTHFLHPDHSTAFYKTLSRFVPNHKELKKELERAKK